MLDHIRHWLQTTLVDRHPHEPVYKTVTEDAVNMMEMAVIDLLSDPVNEYSIHEEYRSQLVFALSQLTGKPDVWITSFIEDQRKKQRGLNAFYAARMEGMIRD